MLYYMLKKNPLHNYYLIISYDQLSLSFIGIDYEKHLFIY